MFDTDIVLKKLDEARRRAEQVGPVEDAHTLLRAVYSNPAVPLPTRIKAAVEALPFELPKLAVTAHVVGSDFASKLDLAIQRSKETDRTNGKMIEAKVIERSKVEKDFEELDL